MLHDLRYSFRMLLKSPGVFAVAVLSLGLGIGLNTALFSFLNAALFRPLPVKDPHRLVSILKTVDGSVPRTGHSYRDYLDYRSLSDVFEGVIAHSAETLYLGALGEAERINGELVSANYFSVLGIRALIGQTFPSQEEQAQPFAVISERFWRARLQADPGVVGRVLTLNAQSLTVIGVVPSTFLGLSIGPAPDLWAPLSQLPQVRPGSDDLQHRGSRWLYVQARLRPGVTQQQAAPVVYAYSRDLEETYPSTNRGVLAALEPAGRLSPRDRSRALPAIGLVFATVLIILLIACANVANLLLARAAARHKEVGVRLALGARGSRIVRQLLTESLVLALAGGLAGLLLSLWTSDLIRWITSKEQGALALDFTPDGRVLLFTLLVSALAGVVFGLAPALRASRTDVVSTLKDEGLTAARGLLRTRTRDSLAVAQVALSLLLLIAAGLLMRAAFRAQQIDPGFDAARVVAVPLDLKLYGYQEASGRALLDQLVARVSAQPGVSATNLAAVFPLSGNNNYTRIEVEGLQAGSPDAGIGFNIVSPGHLATLGIPLLAGRDFSPADAPNSPQVAIVNQTFASRFWPGQNVIGKGFRSGRRYLEVVGVAKTVMYRDLGESPQPHFYLSLEQNRRLDLTLLVRTDRDPRATLAAVRGHLRAVDSRLQAFGAGVVLDRVSRSWSAARVVAGSFGAFAGLALALAVIGVYGVVAYTVSQRTREIGVRIALGASHRDVLLGVLGRGLRLGIIGIVIGIAAAVAGTRILASNLYGLSPTDPLIFSLVSLFLLAMVLVASYMPARKAARVDPMVALRYQ